MSFAEPSPKFTNFRRTEFMSLGEGNHLIRILEPKATKKYAHYVNRTYVECLGEDCPICDNNNSLRLQYPQSFRKEPTYNSRSTRYYVNVVDLTPAKVCPSCQREYKSPTAPSVCECGTTLGAVSYSPLNKIKVLGGGVTLFEDHLNALETAIRNEAGEPVGLMAFDISLVVTGTGKDKVITPIPMPVSDLKMKPEGEPFDLNKSIIHLDADEMLDLQRGISVKDIFTARKSNPDSTVEDVLVRTAEGQSVVDSISSRAEDLFKNG